MPEICGRLDLTGTVKPSNDGPFWGLLMHNRKKSPGLAQPVPAHSLPATPGPVPVPAPLAPGPACSWSRLLPARPRLLPATPSPARSLHVYVQVAPGWDQESPPLKPGPGPGAGDRGSAPPPDRNPKSGLSLTQERSPSRGFRAPSGSGPQVGDRGSPAPAGWLASTWSWVWG